MKPPFGRMGGKSKIAKELINLFPKDFKIFVEPFVGAGNIFFRKPYIEGQKEVINDLDKDVYKILNGLKTRSKYINNNIHRTISRQHFDSIKNKKDVLSTLEKIKMSFFNQGKSFNNSKEGDKIMTDFKPYGERLKNTIILNETFEKVIKQYDSTETFFYLDPPYESEEKKDYKDYVEPIDVYDALKNIKGKFMLSYNDSKNIRKIFSKYNIKTIITIYENAQHVGKREIKELIITNYWKQFKDRSADNLEVNG